MASDFEEMFGPEIGQGAQATVYARGEYAVKLYRENYPKYNVFSEAFIMANLEMEGFPSPKIYEVLIADKRYGLRMDRVHGKSVSDIMTEKKDDPEGFKEILRNLTELQCRLQKECKIGSWAPDIKPRLRNDLVRNERLSDVCRERLIRRLDELPDGMAVNHCDFHPGNVFFDGTNYMIIDLLQVCRGDPAADAACSYVSYSMLGMDLEEPYLDMYCEISEIPRERVQQWLPVYAGSILGSVPEVYTKLLENLIAKECPL